MSKAHPITYAMNPGAKAKMEAYDAEIARENEAARMTARIAELEAQNKRLVDIVDRLCWSIENGDFPESSYWAMFAENARALLAEVTA